MQQIGIVAVFGGRHAILPKPMKRVVAINNRDAIAPAFVAEWRIRDHVVERRQGFLVFCE